MITAIRNIQTGRPTPQRYTNGAAEVYENMIVELEHELIVAADATSVLVHGVTCQRAAASAEISIFEADIGDEIAITYSGTPVIHQHYGISVTTGVPTLSATNTSYPLFHVQRLETQPDGTAVAICNWIPTILTARATAATT